MSGPRDESRAERIHARGRAWLGRGGREMGGREPPLSRGRAAHKFLLAPEPYMDVANLMALADGLGV